jgi:hypothetical protein
MTESYRDNEDWKDAFTTVKEAYKDQPEIKAVTDLMQVLAWRSPGHKVAWHKRTPPGTVAYAKANGIVPGTELPEAMDTLLKALPKGVSTTALKKATKVVGLV